MSVSAYRKRFAKHKKKKSKTKLTLKEYLLGERLEFHECVDLVSYLEDLKKLGKVLVYSHTPNETFTPYRNQKTKNYMMGVRSGIPDYVIVTTNDVLFIEMKRSNKSNKTTKSQKQWLEALADKPVHSKVCYGFNEAKEFIEYTLKNPAFRSHQTAFTKGKGA